MYKQIFLTLDREIWEQAKLRSLEVEKRSLTGQLRKLFADLGSDDDFLQHLGDKFRETLDPHVVDSQNLVKITLKFPEEEFWQARVKSSKAKMMLKEFTASLVQHWLDGTLTELVRELRDEEKADQQSLVRKAN